MGSNYGFSDWLADMQSAWDSSISALPWRVVTFLAVLFVISAIASLFLCIWRSFTFDIAVKEDIVQDRVQCVNSWYCGQDYKTVEIPKEILRIHMLRANLSYHTFWNVSVLGRWRICGEPHNRIYFKVNRFSDNNFDIFRTTKRLFTLYSLSFIWGYPIFLIITLLRMAFKKGPLC